MTTQLLNVDYLTNVVRPYASDLGVALVFGLGYYLFKFLNKKEDRRPRVGDIKDKVLQSVSKWENAKSIHKYNSMIIANNDKNTDAFKILNAMQKAGINPDIVTYNCLIDMSHRLEHKEQAIKLCEEINDFTNPVQPDTVTFNILLKGLVFEIRENKDNKEMIEKLLAKVKNIFTDLRARGNISPNEITFNTAIDACIESENVDEAWNFFNEMAQCGVKPDLYTYSTLVKGLKQASELSESNLQKALDILEKINNGECENIHADEILYNSVIDTCIKYNKINIAEKLYNEMTSKGIFPSTITYSIMIKAHGTAYHLDAALSLYNEMKLSNIRRNDVIYGCLINCCVRCSRLDIMNEMYENMQSDNIEPNIIIYNTLVKGFNKMKKFNKAFELYEKMIHSKNIQPNVVIYNSILDCCVESKNFDKLFLIYEEIKTKAKHIENFPQLNVITHSTVMKGYCKLGDMQKAKELYNFIKSGNYQLDEVIYNTMADGFSRAKDHESARNMLADMKELGIIRSSVIYSILIKMYSNDGMEEQALNIIKEMNKDCIKPGLVTYTTLMQLFIRLKKLDKAIEIFQEMKKNEVKVDYVSYNFIINGCVFNKKLEVAISLLIESIKANIKLSDETYNNVFEYLLSNKFMKQNERAYHATAICKELKEKNFEIDYEMYSRVMRLLFKKNEHGQGNKGDKGDKNDDQKEKNHKETLYKNYNNFSNNNFGTGSGNQNQNHYNNYQKKNDGFNRGKRHNYNK